ncbi:MAG: M20/M25/M40 family metallo-hydrolase [Clostridia bacterium]|nr:M20/M25/M40 family metallo-hydrolase [Clostridia bacterium]
MNIYTTLQKLCACPSISGREDNIRGLLSELMLPYADEMRVDALGNLIAKKNGKGEGESIMLCAHMDEIGFLVNFIEDSGMIRVATIGGISFSASAFTSVISEKGVRGALVPEDKTKPADYKADKFYIDVGAKNKKDAERRVSIGDFFVAEGGVTKLMGKRVMGRPLDDRIGCAVLLDIAEKLKDTETDGDVYYVFSVQEEVGCRGSMTAAFGISPDYSLCFDVTGTGDTLGATSMACKLGGGAAVKIKDSSVICSEEVVNTLCRIAEEKKIPYQREILTYGGTDTSSMQLSGAGSLAGALSIPTRYIHSGVETCDLADAEACVALAVEFVKELN